MIVAFASDHAGFDLKSKLINAIEGDFEILDLGTNSSESVDYPDYGYAMGRAITEGVADYGVLVCGTGIGISIAANRMPAVRAAVCTSVEMAELSRLHNDANVLSLGSRIIDFDTALKCLEAFLNTECEGGRHERRVKKLLEENVK